MVTPAGFDPATLRPRPGGRAREEPAMIALDDRGRIGGVGKVARRGTQRAAGAGRHRPVPAGYLTSVGNLFAKAASNRV